MSTLRDADDVPIPLDPAPMIPHTHSQHSGMMPPMNDDLGRISDTVNTDQDPEDDMDPGKHKTSHLRLPFPSCRCGRISSQPDTCCTPECLNNECVDESPCEKRTWLHIDVRQARCMTLAVVSHQL